MALEIVLITGEVPDEETKSKVEREVRAIEGVMNVTNELEIGFASSYTSRSNDALITSKVKLSLADAKDISANSFKVVTEKGAVFLMGRVTQREGVPWKRIRIWPGRRCTLDWVASTCTSSLCPIPQAIAPRAPIVQL